MSAPDWSLVTSIYCSDQPRWKQIVIKVILALKPTDMRSIKEGGGREEGVSHNWVGWVGMHV